MMDCKEFSRIIGPFGLRKPSCFTYRCDENAVQYIGRVDTFILARFKFIS